MFRDLSSSEDLTWLLPDNPDAAYLFGGRGMSGMVLGNLVYLDLARYRSRAFPWCMGTLTRERPVEPLTDN